MLLVVQALVAIGVTTLRPETKTRPSRDCLPQHQLVPTTALWRLRHRRPMSVVLALLTSGEGYPHRIPRFGEGLRARIPRIYVFYLRTVQNRLYPRMIHPTWTVKHPVRMTTATMSEPFPRWLRVRRRSRIRTMPLRFTTCYTTIRSLTRYD